MYVLKLTLIYNNERINFNHMSKNVNITTKNILDIFSFSAKSYCKIIVFKLKSSSMGTQVDIVFGLDSQASPFLKTLLIKGLAK